MTSLLTKERLQTDNDSQRMDQVSESLNVLESMYLYNHWIYTKIRPYVGGHVLEVGAGIGNITQFLLSSLRVIALEPYPPNARRVLERFSDHQNVTVLQETLEQFSDDFQFADVFDTVLCLNVLEHIKDDVSALRQMRAQLNPSGRVVILAPAMKMLYGSLDESFGHFRRYSKRLLCRRFEEAGLAVEKSFYMNMPGVLGWFLNSCILHRRRIEPEMARRYEKVVPYLFAAESICTPPIGQSLVMIGRRA